MKKSMIIGSVVALFAVSAFAGDVKTAKNSKECDAAMGTWNKNTKVCSPKATSTTSTTSTTTAAPAAPATK